MCASGISIDADAFILNEFRVFCVSEPDTRTNIYSARVEISLVGKPIFFAIITWFFVCVWAMPSMEDETEMREHFFFGPIGIYHLLSLLLRSINYGHYAAHIAHRYCGNGQYLINCMPDTTKPGFYTCSSSSSFHKILCKLITFQVYSKNSLRFSPQILYDWILRQIFYLYFFLIQDKAQKEPKDFCRIFS